MVDEIKGTAQGVPPGEQGQSSGSRPESTSPKPIVFTEAEVSKRISDSLADAGRKHAASIKALEERLRTIDAEKEREDEEKARGNPDLENIFRTRKQLREEQDRIKAEKAALETEKASMEEDRRLAGEYKLNKTIEELAVGYEGVDKVKLKNLVTSFKANTAEQITVLLDTMAVKKGTQPVAPITMPKPDSGITSGGYGKITNERAETMTDDEYFNHPDTKARYK